MNSLLCVQQSHGAAIAGILAWELDSLSHFLHGQVPYRTETASTTGAALHPLLACVADEVATLTLVDGREDIVETDGAFEEGSKISRLGGDTRDNGSGYTSSRHVGCDLEGHVRTQGLRREETEWLNRAQRDQGSKTRGGGEMARSEWNQPVSTCHSSKELAVLEDSLW